MMLPLILAYHKVERRHELGVTRISPARFARQVERLAREGWRTLSVAELEDRLTSRVGIGERELAITFDDAYRGLREHAFPVLRANGFTAICAVITEYAGRLNTWDVAYGGRRFAHLAWRDMRRWQGQGIEFVSHTATHRRLRWLGARDVGRELRESRLALRDALGIETTTISYPFGAAGGRERAIAAAEGYSLGLTIGVRWSGELLGVPRLPVYLWSTGAFSSRVARRAERIAGAAANRFAVGTSVILSLSS